MTTSSTIEVLWKIEMNVEFVQEWRKWINNSNKIFSLVNPEVKIIVFNNTSWNFFYLQEPFISFEPVDKSLAMYAIVSAIHLRFPWLHYRDEVFILIAKHLTCFIGIAVKNPFHRVGTEGRTLTIVNILLLFLLLLCIMLYWHRLDSYMLPEF